jgi:hypothetical protein
MSTIKSTRFNDLLPLFQSGANGTIANANTSVAVPVTDHRPRLYLAALSEASEQKKPLVLSKDMPELQNGNFNPTDKSKGDNEIHPQWDNFKEDMNTIFGRNNLITNPTLVKIIKDLAGRATDKLTQLKQEIIQLHFIVKGPALLGPGPAPARPDDITNMPTQWGDAVSLETNPSTYAPIMTNVSAGTSGTGKTEFDFKISKYLLHLKLESAANAPTGSGDPFWTTDESTNDTYFRLASDRTKLYRNDASGNKLDVTKGSAHFNTKYMDGATCSSHYVKDSGSNTCTGYLKQCISSGKPSDIKACKDFMQDANFWTDITKEVHEMLPTNIEDTLKQFGFQTETRNNLIEFESTGSWFKNLDSQVSAGALTQGELDAIRTNTKLKAYLNLLVNKINANPAILNPEYNARYTFDAEDHMNSFKNWTLASILKPRVMVETNNDLSYITRLSNVVATNLVSIANISRNRVSVGPSGNVLVLGMPFWPVSYKLYGGSDEMIGGGHVLSNYNQNQIRENYPVLKMMLGSIESSIQKRGKSLDASTKQHINDYLEKYRESEEKLFKAIKYADKYIDLVELYGQYDSDKVLSIDHLKKFVEARDKYLNKTSGKQNDILSAIEQLTRSVIDAVDKKL